MNPPTLSTVRTLAATAFALAGTMTNNYALLGMAFGIGAVEMVYLILQENTVR